MYKDHEMPRFWTTYAEAVRKYISKRVADKAVVEDILHDVYIKIFCYCKRYDFCCQKAGVRNLRSWVFQVCHNTLVDYYKEQGRYTLQTEPVVEQIAPKRTASGKPAAKPSTEVQTSPIL
jgi:DNA-directed RNA polymerase specialized sigma24 family protein